MPHDHQGDELCNTADKHSPTIQHCQKFDEISTDNPNSDSPPRRALPPGQPSHTYPSHSSPSPSLCPATDQVISHTPAADKGSNWAEMFMKQNFSALENNALKNCLYQDELKMDLMELRQEGFVHWEDQHMTSSLGPIESFWTPGGLEILNSVLANQRLRKILLDWFDGPCVIGHWLWWGTLSTTPFPACLARAEADSPTQDHLDLPCLCLHILDEASSVRYESKSHRDRWPRMDGGLWFTRSFGTIEQSKDILNGL